MHPIGMEREVALLKLRTCLEKGMYDDEIQQETCYAPDVIKELREELGARESASIRQRPTEEIYALYIYEQRRCISDLNEVVDDFKSNLGKDLDEKGDRQKNRNINGYVGAIKTRSEILDKILKTGQDLGIIKRDSSNKGLFAGQAIINMTNIELKQYVLGEVQALHQMMADFGDQDITAIDVGPLHKQIGPPKDPVKAHARTAVHGGRRVVKEV